MTMIDRDLNDDLRTDVELSWPPRARAGAAIDPAAAYRAANYQARVAAVRPALGGAGGKRPRPGLPDHAGQRQAEWREWGA